MPSRSSVSGDDAKLRVRTLEQDLDAALERERGGKLQRALEAAQEEKNREKNQETASDEELARSRAEIIALRSELEAARRDSQVEAAPDGEDDGLRASIHALGLAVALLSREAKEPKLPKAVALRAQTPAGSAPDLPS